MRDSQLRSSDPSSPTPAKPHGELSRGRAVTISVLAFGAAIGGGQLVAGLIAPLSSPYQAVADWVIRLAPPSLVEFGKGLSFAGLPAGRADKVTLLVGVGVALLLIAVGAGLCSPASARPGQR